jgi:uncharacterized protein (DUF488 family)
MAVTQIYTIGFAKKSAEEFFGRLRQHRIQLLVDVRLHNTSQLAGFTKKADLSYFLREILGAQYLHEPMLAPTEELLRDYQKGRISWAEYERSFLELLRQRQVEKHIPKNLFAKPTVLLCSEYAADYCHRRLVAEYLAEKWGSVDIIHL